LGLEEGKRLAKSTGLVSEDELELEEVLDRGCVASAHMGECTCGAE